MTKYSLTPEHRAAMKPWANKWIANAMSTAAMTEEDRTICRGAVQRIYVAGGKEPPPPERIVFVPSPFVLAFGTGFAAAIWYKRAATEDATWAATEAATWDATSAATSAATKAATWDATSAATKDATEAATWDATWDATSDAADLSKWYVIPADMVAPAKQIGVGGFGLACAARAWNLWQGGNQWSGPDAFYSFFRHVAGLGIDYCQWDAWETLSWHSGPRTVHEKFCMISDRPEILLVDDRNRPHCDTGPFCKWRDGSALYSIHGVRLPAWIVERPQDITVEKIGAETNLEIRRIMIDRFPSGAGGYMLAAGAERLDYDEKYGTLYRLPRAGEPDMVMVHVVNNTREPDGALREFFLRVHPELRPMRWDKTLGEPQAMTAHNAVASTWGYYGHEFRPEVRT